MVKKVLVRGMFSLVISASILGVSILRVADVQSPGPLNIGQVAQEIGPGPLGSSATIS